MPIVSGGLGTTQQTAGPWYAQYDPSKAPVGSAYTDPRSPEYRGPAGQRGSAIPSATDPLGTGWNSSMQQAYGAPGGGGGGTTSVTGASMGGVSPFDVSAQAAQIRSDIAQIRKRSMGAMNEDVAARGIFSSGVAGQFASDIDTRYGQQEASELERLRNDASQRAWQMQMEQQRFDWDKQRAAMGQGAQRYGNANEIQAMQEAYGMGGPTGAIYSSKKPGGTPVGGVPAPGGAPAPGGSAAMTRRDASYAFYRQFGKWPSPAELDQFLAGTYIWNAAPAPGAAGPSATGTSGWSTPESGIGPSGPYTGYY